VRKARGMFGVICLQYKCLVKENKRGKINVTVGEKFQYIKGKQ
jgi:hypothetical protein